jgi:hypothetical protein
VHVSIYFLICCCVFHKTPSLSHAHSCYLGVGRTSAAHKTLVALLLLLLVVGGVSHQGGGMGGGGGQGVLYRTVEVEGGGGSGIGLNGPLQHH